MKILQINTFSYKSTGNIMMELKSQIENSGNDAVVIWGRGRNANKDNKEYNIGNKFELIIHGLLARIYDGVGIGSIFSTYKLIKIIREEKPDIIHLHNVHGYYINIHMLFSFLESQGTKVVWTFHDCWPFTGHCTHFEAVNCKKWKNGCYSCPQTNMYPRSIIDRSNKNWNKKKKLFLLKNLNIVTVSKWLENKVRMSFFNECNIETIYNGIDLTVFKNTISDVKCKYNCENKNIVLGVASDWSERKGLYDFIELSKMINDDYIIILVGINDKQKRKLTNNIIGISRTNNVKELVELYSAADVFFNPSIEETMGMTTVEAMACGTPAIVYNTTASPEVLDILKKYVVNKKNLDEVLKLIYEIVNSKPNPEEIRKVATKYEKNKQYRMYLDLYNRIANKEE